MSTWTLPAEFRPEIELLVRRWQLPSDRILDVEALFRAQQEGGTAYRLPIADVDFGPAALDLRSTQGGSARAQPQPSFAAPTAPLVILSHGTDTFLQSWRYYIAETQIAQALLTRAKAASPASLASAATTLPELGLNDRQRQAVSCALTHRLALITGGPGTGKTYTIARLLALQLAAGTEPESIQLAAPTGKAANRMTEAVVAAAERLPESVEANTRAGLKRIASSASTLHRLLGANPSTGTCRFNAERRLPCRILVVDECSMVDTLLWRALLAALRDDAQLVLLGDPHQLESVRAGDVLGSLVRFAQSHSVLGQCWVELTESQRFKHRPGIGALARAIVASDPDAALKLLRRARQETSATMPDAGLVYLGETPFAYPALPQAVREAVETVAFADTPEAALAALDRVRFLAAHREHSFGVAGLNASIQRHIEQLAAERGASTPPLHPPALPIVVNRNDAETALSNGSVGVIMTVNGARAAYFPAATAGAPPRRIGVSQLPEHSPAWAMTIHRSQGSEFDHVVVFLPGDESPLATRELLYTATTRAKDHVYLSGPEATVRAALSNRTLRCTLIERALCAPPTPQPPQ